MSEKISEKMTPNAGGSLAIDQIVGRDLFIERIWKALEGNSLRMEAERRIGKTSILRKMAAQPPEGWEAVFMDLEHVHSADEFAEEVSRHVFKCLKGWSKHAKRLLEFLGQSVEEAGPLKLREPKERPEGYWKTLLRSSIEDLVEQQQAADKRVAFLFDEMPWMIGAIQQKEGEHAAMQVLDLLRSLRQSPETSSGFRMILCGSIGLHHVLTSLKEEGYINQPVNDMTLIEVPPLNLKDATKLAQGLLKGAEIEATPDAAESIATAADGFPYYIHAIVAALQFNEGKVNVPVIEQVIKGILTAPHDPCNFRHFKDRIKHYYPDDITAVISILNHAAASTATLTQADLINAAKSSVSIDDERVRNVIRLLQMDHYLDRDQENHFSFRNKLVKRWWVLEQGLTAKS